MDVAIVTGADSRFGDAVARTLLKMGFRIHALGQSPDPTGYDERFYVPHPYGPGKLAELKEGLEAALEEEGRLDLLVGLGGPEIAAGWEAASPENLVRRLHGCLTEPLLAARVCLPALLENKGFLIHGHRRPVAPDLTVSQGYFEGAMRRAYDDLFLRHASEGLRSARILYAHPEEEAEGAGMHQDIAESVSSAFEVILRQKETCVIREMVISPRGLGPAGRFPNLVAGVDPYQTPVLPEGDTREEDPILIPTEKPRRYIQIAEVEDISEGADEADDEDWDDEEEEEDGESAESDRDGGQGKRPQRSRTRSRKKPAKKPGGHPKEDPGGEASDSGEGEGGDKPPARKRARKGARKRPSRKPKKPASPGGEGETAERSADPQPEKSGKPEESDEAAKPPEPTKPPDDGGPAPEEGPREP